MLTSWFHRSQKAGPAEKHTLRRRSRRCTSRSQRYGRRPQLESLEDRCLPSVYVVTNVNDDGVGSLRQAILDVNADSSPDTIDFNIPGSGVQTIAVGNPTGCPCRPSPI